MSPFHSAVFFKSAATLEDVPASTGEVAFAGRSNAGKSSAINALVGKRLAFVSKTPGRTQLINFFSLGTDRFIVDLPGYGYAKVPEAVRAPWAAVLGGYLQRREPLCGLVVVMDIRHPLTERDRHLLKWFRATGKPVHILLTKADKLSRAAGHRILADVAREAATLSPNCSVQLFSSLKKWGLEQAAETFGAWLNLMPDGRIPGQAGRGF
jgi:GTP-binding protein